MLSEAQKRDVVSRLNRVEGQIRGIRRMVDEPRRCIDIVQELSAAEAALGKISHLILKLHPDTPRGHDRCFYRENWHDGSDGAGSVSRFIAPSTAWASTRNHQEAS